MDVKKVRKRAAMWAGYAAFVLCCFAAGYLIAWAGNSGGRVYREACKWE